MGNLAVLSVTFEIDAHSHGDGQFSIPADVCKILGELRNGDTIRLLIMTPGGALLFSGDKQLSSGSEIYGADIKHCVKAGQRIRVIASHA